MEKKYSDRDLPVKVQKISENHAHHSWHFCFNYPDISWSRSQLLLQTEFCTELHIFETFSSHLFFFYQKLCSDSWAYCGFMQNCTQIVHEIVTSQSYFFLVSWDQKKQKDCLHSRTNWSSWEGVFTRQLPFPAKEMWIGCQTQFTRKHYQGMYDVRVKPSSNASKAWEDYRNPSNNWRIKYWICNLCLGYFTIFNQRTLLTL